MSVSDAEARRREARSWLALAQADRHSAALCAGTDPPLVGIAAFHCQQAAEKILKGFLVCSGTDFRRTHDLRELGDAVVAARPDMAELVRAVEDWTVWATAYRYPSAEGSPEPEPTPDELQKALRVVDSLASRLSALLSARDDTR
jgi:HEPN domain-containing protein